MSQKTEVNSFAFIYYILFTVFVMMIEEESS